MFACKEEEKESTELDCQTTQIPIRQCRNTIRHFCSPPTPISNAQVKNTKNKAASLILFLLLTGEKRGSRPSAAANRILHVNVRNSQPLKPP